ncbi:YfhE family protein [Bacillus sp. FJAT-47783]
MVDKKKKHEKNRSNLSSAQEVTYSRDFKMADRAGGYTDGEKH